MNLIQQNRIFQNAILFKVGVVLTSQVNETQTNFIQYFKLKEINDSLVAENARLKFVMNKPIPESNLRDTIFSKDSVNSFRVLQLKPARVIHNSVEINQNNYITIDKGRKDGIRKDMAVLSESSIVGIVNGVSENYASVVPMLHQGLRTSGRVKRNNDIGKVYWSGENPNLLTMTDIGDFSDVRKGDTIVTTAFSSIFPADIPIGIVTEVGRKAGSNYFNLDLKPLTRFSSLYYVYVLEDAKIQEKRILEKSFQSGD